MSKLVTLTVTEKNGKRHTFTVTVGVAKAIQKKALRCFYDNNGRLRKSAVGRIRIESEKGKAVFDMPARKLEPVFLVQQGMK